MMVLLFLLVVIAVEISAKSASRYYCPSLPCGISGVYVGYYSQYNFFSPGYPEPYPEGIECLWQFYSPYFTALRLQCDFDTKPSTDCLQDMFYFSPSGNCWMDDGYVYCGFGYLDVITQYNHLAIRFHSKAKRHTHRGFNCTVSAVYPVGATELSVPDANLPIGFSSFITIPSTVEMSPPVIDEAISPETSHATDISETYPPTSPRNSAARITSTSITSRETIEASSPVTSVGATELSVSDASPPIGFSSFMTIPSTVEMSPPVTAESISPETSHATDISEPYPSTSPRNSGARITSTSITSQETTEAGSPVTSPTVDTSESFLLTSSLHSVASATITSTTNIPTTNPNKQICECGIKGNSRIVGGNEAANLEWPWQVGIRRSIDGITVCGGSLISDWWVVTAAHCVDGRKIDQMYLVLGEHNTFMAEGTELFISIDAIIMHENYNSTTIDNDISLLRLQRSVTSFDSGKISPICLPTNYISEDFIGENATVTGWGTLQFQGPVSNVLMEVNIPIVDCQDYKIVADETTDNMICTYEYKKDSCQGDSGGPLKVQRDGKYNLIGIVSFGHGCGGFESPGVYTKVTNYVKWIEDKTGESFC